MQFDPENPVNKLCAQGIMLEGEGKATEAAELFSRAWEQAANAKEKFTSAHYVARHQTNAAEKLQWDETALSWAMDADDPEIEHVYPSLYLNIAKGFEDLKDLDNAAKNYQLALHYAAILPDDGYSNMIRSGINSGIARIQTL